MGIAGARVVSFRSASGPLPVIRASADTERFFDRADLAAIGRHARPHRT
ncbi:hypothetical protein J4G37_20100 [Microvirga sp. 3-52]|nr:hypothetical protein [Microvirga sp. 3-52]